MNAGALIFLGIMWVGVPLWRIASNGKRSAAALEALANLARDRRQ